jgi:hypothetical protein
MSRIHLKPYLILVFLLLGLTGQSQDLKSLVRSGDIAAQNGNYYGAAHFYKQALRIDANIPELHHKMAEACRKDRDYVPAAKHYDKLAPQFNDKYPHAEYYLAKMLKARGEYLTALYHYRSYYNRMKEHTQGDLRIVKAKREIIACEIAQRLMFRPKNLSVNSMDTTVNTMYAELCADGFADSLIFYTSVQPLDTATDVFEAGIYLNNTSASRKLDSQINRYGMHAANPFYDSLHSRLYFTLSDAENPPHIYVADMTNGHPENLQILPPSVNTPGYASTHPALVHTDSVSYLLYASNRPDGCGGYDLYYNIIRDGGNYGRPYNIGRRVQGDGKFAFLVDTSSVFNTPGNDVTPFYDKQDSTLYFSSDWYYGMGEYDVFAMPWAFNLPDTNTIKNLGYPVNTPQNDLYYRIDKGHKRAYLTSNRDGAIAPRHQSCCNDIFWYNLPREVKAKTPEEIRQEEIAGMKKMAEELIPITLYFHNDRPDPGSWDTTTTVSYDQTVKDYMELQASYRKKFVKGLEGEAERLAADSIDYFFEQKVNAEYQRLRKFMLLLEELLEEEQQIVMTIKGYTSPLNTPEYNLNLAKRRISSFKNFIHEYKGGILNDYIDAGLLDIETVPFGESQVKKGISDDPSDRRNSVYNPLAAEERKIELIAVKVHSD